MISKTGSWDFEDRFYAWLAEYNQQSGISGQLRPEQQRLQSRRAYRRLVTIMLSNPDVSAAFDIWLTEYNANRRPTLPDNENRKLRRAAWLRFRDGFLLKRDLFMVEK